MNKSDPKMSDDATPRPDETVPSTMSEESATASSSDDDVEFQIEVRSEVARARGAHAATAEVIEIEDENGATDRVSSKCEFCNAKKAKSCAKSACKKCCVRQAGECAAHSKTATEAKPKDPAPQSAPEVLPVHARRLRKPVIKNEFKEPNIAYYNETVVLFCARDFFEAKKISQPIINDQIRALRVNGMNAAAEMTKKPAKRLSKNTELKDLIFSAFPDGLKRRKTDVVA